MVFQYKNNLVDQVEKAAQRIQQSEALLFCAGAGMGVDSGLPDFRGDKGFWKAYPPFAKLGYSFIDMANPRWFQKNPYLAWGFYGHRLNLYRETSPHRGFEVLLKWGQQKPGSYFVFTSNVDGQFQMAGFDNDKVNECHGSIHHLQCSLPCGSSTWPADEIQIKVDETSMNAKNSLPACSSCGKIARPNILMFGDWNWISDRSGHQQTRFQDWLKANKNKSIAIIECGAGTGVPTVRMTSESIASRFNAHLIRINPREPEVPSGQIGIPLGALEAIKKIGNLISPSS